MPFVVVNNKQIEVDIYDRVPDAVEVTHLATSIGLVECTMQPTYFEGQMLIHVDLWQGQAGGKLSITNFRAGVLMRWESNRYRIVDKTFRDYNDLWRELEILLSNAIEVNS